MSLSSGMKIGAVLVALAVAPALSACVGFTPVYSDAGIGAQRVDVKYSKPSNRLEQIIYQDLALKLGKSGGDVPTVSISVSASLPTTDTTTATLSIAKSQVSVSAFVSVVSPDGKVILQSSRSVVEEFVLGGQAFANSQAAREATERGARELSDSIRLQILAALVKQQRQ